MLIRFLVLTLFSITCVTQEGEFYSPPTIEKCLKKAQSNAGQLVLLKERNPFYLRGDFRGLGVADYAVTVRIPGGDRRNGVLVCAADGKTFLLGGSAGHPFSDMAEDRFVAPYWDVMSKERVRGMREEKANVPNPVPDPRGESIAMIWEDGIALIYWDGKQFKWAGAKH